MSNTHGIPESKPAYQLAAATMGKNSILISRTDVFGAKLDAECDPQSPRLAFDASAIPDQSEQFS